MSNDRTLYRLGGIFNKNIDDPHLKQAEQEMREAGFNDCYFSQKTVGDPHATRAEKELTCYQLSRFWAFFTKADYQTADYRKLTKHPDSNLGLSEVKKYGRTFITDVDLNKKKM